MPLLAAGGLAAFLALADAGGGNQTPSLYDWGLVSIAAIGGCTHRRHAHPGRVAGLAGGHVRRRRAPSPSPSPPRS